MVRSMMNLITLPLSFWDYALESTTRILNMVPTKKVDKTPYELWYGKVPNMSYLKVWGCETLMKRDTLDKLQQRSVKCIFIRYPKETMGYYFYFPPENKIVVASEIPMEVEGFEPPQEEVILVRRSERTHRALDHLCLNVEAEEQSLGDLNEPTSYKASVLDSESNKWINAMNAEIQSMMNNMVWVLVDVSPGCKTVRTKGYTQLYEANYEETFSPVTDIRAIRILISIAAFYDYDIWQIDVKNAFFNGYLDEDIIWYNLKLLLILIILEKYASCKDQFMILSKHQEAGIKDLMKKSKAKFILGIKIYRDRSKRLIGLGQNAYMDKILKRYKMDNSKRGHIPMQQRLDLNKTQGASTPEEVKCMQNVPYASVSPAESHWTAVKNILKYLRNTKDMLLVYSGNPEAELRVDFYCDTGFETNKDDMKSQTGYILF
ncbi:retrotransposon protein, putative, ty1-copia subclass [Tanacetum coccineum]